MKTERLRRALDWLIPPGSGDDFFAWRQRSTRIISLAVALASGLAALGLLLEGRLAVDGWQLLTGALLSLLVLELNRRGWQNLAGLMLSIGLVIVHAWILIAGNGIHDIAVILYPVLMLVISLVLEGWLRLVGFALPIASAGLVVFAEQRGWLHTAIPGALTSPADFWIVAVILGLTGVSLTLIDRLVMHSLVRLHQTAQALRVSEARYRALAEDLQQRTHQMTVINQISQAVNELHSLDEILETARRYLQSVLPLDVFFVALWDAEKNEISYPILYDQGQRYEISPHPLEPRSRFYQVITTNQPFLLNRGPEEMEKRQGFLMIGDTSRVSASILYAPLRHRERVIGVISAQSYAPNAYTAEHQDLLLAVASQIGVAVENARLYTRLQGELEERQRSETTLRQRTEQLMALNEITYQIASLQDQDSLLRIILAQLQQAMSLDAFFVALLEDGQNRLRFPLVYDAGAFYTLEPRPIRPGAWMDQCCNQGQSLLVLRTPQEIETAPAEDRFGDTSRVSASIMIAPLQVGERIIGAVSAQSYTFNAYTSEHLDFLRNVASQLAVALENARLYCELQAELAERQRSEAALRQSEARLRALVENIPYDLWMCDVQGRYVLQSAISRHIAGDIIGKTIHDLDFPADLKQRWAELHQQALEGKVILEEDEWSVKGDLRSFVTILAPVREGETIMGFVGINLDVTDLKRSEAALRHYAARIEILHEIDQAILAVRSPQEIAVAALSRLHRLVPCSSASLALLDVENLTAQIVATFAEGETRPGDTQVIPFHDPDRLELLLQGEVVYITDLVTQPLEGPPSLNRVLLQGPIHAVIAVPLRHKEKLVGVLSVGAEERGQLTPEDVQIVQEIATQLAISIYQAQLTANLEQLNVELEQRVQSRTAELAAAYQELEAFSYSVSHDLRAPLRGISGYLKLLLEDYGDSFSPEVMQYLNKVETSARRMNALIDDLLRLSRLGRQEVRRVRFKLGDLVQQVVNEALAACDPSRVRVTVYPLPYVQADPGLLRQVWQNLLDNAIKYSRSRAVAEIEIGSLVQNGETVFYIRDNGVGFDMEYANRLFLPFERLHRQDEFEGTGIGLALARRILQRHGGRIWAQAAPGEGATFYFTLGGEKS